MVAWVITADHADDRVQEEFRCFVPSLVGVVGPEECTLKPEEIAGHPLARPFRLSDEHGILREGFVLGHAGDLPPTLDSRAEPWHSICGDRAYTVEVFQNGVWQKSKYLGVGGCD